MNQNISPKIISLAFGILVICFAIAFYVVAWQEPSQAPPEGNVPTPLNVGSSAQTKAGDLTIQGFLSTLKDFVVGSITVKSDGSISPNLNSDKLDDYHAADLLAGAGGVGTRPIYKRIFITSTRYTGDLGGINGANAKCQARADAAGLGGTWKALLVTHIWPLSKQFPEEWDYLITTAGGIVMKRESAFCSIDGTNYIYNVILNEFGVFGGGLAWTGIGEHGGIDGRSHSDPHYNCQGWTDDNPGVFHPYGAWTGHYGIVGAAGVRTGDWLYRTSPQQCNTSQNLYCIEQ